MFSPRFCLLRSECSVSHQPLPLRPASPHPQPDATFLHVPAAPAHALLQPVAAPPSAPPATRPPLLSYTTSCRTPGPSLQPPAAAAPPFSPTGAPHSVADTDTQPQPLPLRRPHLSRSGLQRENGLFLDPSMLTTRRLMSNEPELDCRSWSDVIVRTWSGSTLDWMYVCLSRDTSAAI